jgi:purine/pyrimidine-nucleoside phosphorylase
LFIVLILPLQYYFMSALKVNEFFEGKVKSISFQGEPYRSTVGVMAPGEYEFGTGKAEIMTVISGELEVKLPGQTGWKKFGASTKFNVVANSKFHLKVAQDTAYLCEFVD